MLNEQKVADSGQGNYYGGLTLVTARRTIANPREFYLRLEDWDGPDYTGPLTMEQVEAFCTLFEVDPGTVLK